MLKDRYEKGMLTMKTLQLPSRKSGLHRAKLISYGESVLGAVIGGQGTDPTTSTTQDPPCGCGNNYLPYQPYGMGYSYGYGYGYGYSFFPLMGYCPYPSMYYPYPSYGGYGAMYGNNMY
jgi:hypothetical protein